MWKIAVDGQTLGTYPEERYAQAAWRSVTQERPRASYTAVLRGPDGKIVKAMQTPVAGKKPSSETTTTTRAS